MACGNKIKHLAHAHSLYSHPLRAQGEDGGLSVSFMFSHWYSGWKVPAQTVCSKYLILIIIWWYSVIQMLNSQIGIALGKDFADECLEC